MDKNNIAIPFSIIVAGLLIAGAVYFGGDKPDIGNKAAPNNPENFKEIKAVGKEDHILGNPNAKVVIVEYSDLQCPFCQQFHTSMNELLNTLGKDGKVAWVYRHLPLTQIHPYAEKAAEGSECAAELGGEKKFFEFIDNIFADGETQANKVKDLSAVAKAIGLDQVKFDACLNGGKYAAKVKEGMNEGIGAGVSGTPTSFILVDGKVVNTIPGVVPIAELKTGIEALLK